jgi:hypothetical protein
VLEVQQPQLGRLTSWAAWKRWRDTVVSHYDSRGRHCPLNVLISQLGRATPGAQAVVSELLRRWQDELEAGIRHLRDAGEVGADVDAGRTAAALLAGIQGGVVVMLSTGRIDHLEAALDVGIANLRASGNRG